MSLSDVLENNLLVILNYAVSLIVIMMRLRLVSYDVPYNRFLIMTCSFV